MRVFRAHDGRSFEVNQPFSQLNTVDDLIDAFSLATGIPSDAIICMSGSGAQLSQESLEAAIRQESIRNAGLAEPHEMVEDPEYFVFNREFLYADLDVLAKDLEEPVDLGPDFQECELPYPPTPRSLAQLLEWSSHLLQIIQSHTSSARELHAHLAAIQRSTSVALLNLVSHASTVRASYEAVGKTAARELDRMQGLLDGHERDLKVLGMVSINPRLLSTANAPSTSRQPPTRERKLGHYIHQEKMTAVFAACTAVHDEIRDRAHELTAKALELGTDTEGLQQEVEGTSIAPSTEELDKVVQALERAEHLHSFLTATCSPDENGWPVADKLAEDGAAFSEVEASVRELFLLGHVGQDALTQLAADKNDMISRALHLLGDISSLQSDFADLSSALTALDSDLRSDRVDGFRHLARLKNVLWAYGATVVEIVRRREFAHRFLGRSQAMAELMAKVSAGERGKRSSFKTDVVALLPWEVKGIDEAPPTLEITTHRLSTEGLAELTRDDIDALMAVLDEVDGSLASEAGSAAAPRTQIPEIKAALLELASRLDSFDADFSRLVEIGLLGKGGDGEESDSGSEDGRPLKDAETQATSIDRELQNARREAAEARRQAAEAHDQELAKLHAEMSRVRAELRGKEAELEHAKHDLQAGRRNLESLRSEAETEAARRINMKEELARLRQDAEDARRAEAAARAEAREEGDRAAELEQHVHDMAVELEEAKAARQDATHRIEALLGEGSSAERELSNAQERIEELSRQLEAARAETREVREHLAEAEAGRDRALRAQRAGAESERATLEESVRSKETALQTALEDKERAEQRAEEAETLRGQLRAADETHEELVRQLDQARESAVEAEMAQRHAERTLDTLLDHTRPLVARNTELRRFVRAMPALTSKSSKAAAAQSDAPSPVLDDEEPATLAALEAFEADAGSAPAEVVLEALRALDAGQAPALCAISRLDSLATLVRKWQKAYKSCSEKLSRATTSAKDRIAFRNFAPGDLALFLPTRNQSSPVKPWAAFNISFPHHFLNATGSLAEQLRSKEWIVARIASIGERVADSSQDGGNPFQLADGVRFFLLDVEAYNHPPARARTGSLTVARSTSAAALPRPGDSAPKSAPELKRHLSEGGVREGTQVTPRGTRRQASEGAKRPSVDAIAEEEKATMTSPLASPGRKRMSDAAVSASLPAAGSAVDVVGTREAIASDVSRSSSPSALTRALRSQPRHPISPDTRHPVGSVSTLGAPRQPWPMAGTSADDASVRSSPAALAPSAAPAFSRGRGRREGDTSPVDERGGSKVQAIPIASATSRSSAAAEAASAAAPLNPFSQSPAPRTSGAEQDYFSPRRRKSSNLAPGGAVRAPPPPPSRSSTTPVSPLRTAGTLPRSVSARSRRISINGTSLMLSHARSSTSGIFEGGPSSAAPPITSPAFFEVPSSSATGGLASVSPSLASAVGETTMASSPSRVEAGSPRASPDIPVSTSQRSSSNGSGFFSAFTLGRRAGSSAAAAAAGGGATPARAAGGSRYPVAHSRLRRGDGEVMRPSASEALRRLAEGR